MARGRDCKTLLLAEESLGVDDAKKRGSFSSGVCGLWGFLHSSG